MTVRIIEGDSREVLATLPAEGVHCVVTSPPYLGLRDYGVAGQIGLEDTPDAYVAEMVAVFREVRRALRDDGTLWLNLGDSYAGGGGFSVGAPSSATSKSGMYGSQGELKAGGIKPSGNVKSKDLMMIPARVALALQADGWWLRSDIIWHKPNPMPESVTDRPTSAHEHVFLLSKSARYFYDAEAVREPAGEDVGPGVAGWAAGAGSHAAKDHDQRGDGSHGHKNPRPSVAKGGFRGKTAGTDKPAFRAVTTSRNLRNVWTIATAPFSDAHFATFPPALVEPCIKAGCPKGGVVLDPFGGAGTVGLVADRLQRDAILIELNPAYAAMARNRIATDGGMFAQVAE